MTIEETKQCSNCGISIVRVSKWSSKQWNNKKYCSQNCQRKGREYHTGGHNKGIPWASPRKCDVCSTVSKKVSFYRAYKATLCQKHYWHLRKWGKALWGDERPLRTPVERRLRNVKDAVIWRKKVFERDNYTCQECGERGGQLQADHIKPFKYFPELRTELTNGRTLCISCHQKTDTYGRRVDKWYDQRRSNITA